MPSRNRYCFESGFTLVEVLVVLGVIGFMAAVIAPGFFGARSKQVLTSMTNRIVADLRNASERARVQEQSNQWGIRFTNPTGSGNDYYEVWYGVDYATGTKISKIYLSPGLILTDPPDNSTKDIIFSKSTGIPTASATVALNSTTLSPPHVGLINISSAGKIDYQIAPNLISYWDFDEGSGTVANDDSGQGNNGTFSVTAPTWQTGVNCKSGSCLSFNGTSNYISVSNSNSLNPTSQITLAAWIKPVNITTNIYYEIMRQDSGNNRKLFSFQDNGIHLTLGLNTGGTYWETDFLITPSYFTDGNWHHVAYTYDGANAILYVDGAQNNSQAHTGAIAAETAGLYIGSWGGTSEFFNGSIDDFRIYSRALSASEIQDLYNILSK